MNYIIVALVSYGLGSVLFGEIVTYAITGKSASQLGTSGNPGMANVMSHLGIVPGLIVLFGDAGKCVVAALLGRMVLGSEGLLYGGFFATLGHDFPLWRHFKGGKGVATTCMLIFMYARWWGLLSLIIGLIVVIITKYLSVGGVVIPLVMIPYAFMHSPIDGAVMMALTLLQFVKHFAQLKLIPSGQAEKNDIIKGLKNKMKKK